MMIARKKNRRWLLIIFFAKVTERLTNISFMPGRWSRIAEEEKRKELTQLYVRENKTIAEVSILLGIGESTVYDRLLRLEIPPQRELKPRYNNQRTDISLPKKYSSALAEFIGILLGDGHITPSQVTVTLGKKDRYAYYVSTLMYSLFSISPKIIFSENGDCIVYFGSTRAVRWFLNMGLVFNKVKNQVDIPQWIFSKPEFIKSAIRGLFDTDGSVYKIRFGMQISFCNHSLPLLRSVRNMLISLGFTPSAISGYNLYLTRRADIDRFFTVIGFKNKKHETRFLNFREFIREKGQVL